MKYPSPTLAIGTAGGLLLTIAGTLFGVGFLNLTSSSVLSAEQPRAGAISPLVKDDYVAAGAGRVEPASEEIRIAAPLTGVLARVAVKEGDHVSRGEILAEMDNREYAAGLQKAEADLQLARAELAKVKNGALPADRAAAMALVREMDANEKNAGAVLDRQRILHQDKVVSQETFDQAQRAYLVAQQRHQAALEKYAAINDPPREEDVAIAQAKVDAAQSARDAAQAVLNETVIKSPIDGTVLRVTKHAGELLSIFFNDPIMIVGDISSLDVRAEIDEADIAKVRPGLPAYVTADAYGERQFRGHIIRVAGMLGKKNIYTDQPSERSDSKVLDVVIALDSPNPLVSGLPVNVFITNPQLSELRSQAE